jgi:hypothetical protein
MPAHGHAPERHRRRVHFEDVVGARRGAPVVTPVVREHQPDVAGQLDAGPNSACLALYEPHAFEVGRLQRVDGFAHDRFVERLVEHEQRDRRVDRRRVFQAPQVQRQIFAEMELALRQRPAERRQNRGPCEPVRGQELAEGGDRIAVVGVQHAGTDW